VDCFVHQACSASAAVWFGPAPALCRRPSFDDVQDLSGTGKFFPPHEFMRQALNPLEIGGNYPLKLDPLKNVPMVL
jgi:hypothetical protein